MFGRNMGRLRIGVLLAVALGAGVLAASALSGGAKTTVTGTTTGTSTATGTATTATGSSISGSTALYVGLLVGLLLFVAVLYGIDLVKANRRQDDVLALAKSNPDLLKENSDFAQVVGSVVNGTDGLVRSLLAFTAVGLFAAALFYVLIKNPDISSSSVVGNAISALITLLTAIVAFYFGSKSGGSGSGGGSGSTS